MKWSPTWASVFFWPVIHQTVILLPPISFSYYRVKLHFLSNKRNLPTITYIYLLVWSVSPYVINLPYLLHSPLHLTNSVWAPKTLHVEALSLYLDSYIIQHGTSFFMSTLIPLLMHWHTLLDHCHVNKVPLTPNHLSRAWAQTPTPHCFLHSPTDCIIMVGLWHPLLGITPLCFAHP